MLLMIRRFFVAAVCVVVTAVPGVAPAGAGAEAGSTLSWGSNIHGTLGDGGTAGRDVPGAVCAASGCPAGLGAATALSGGAAHSLALMPDGTVLAWGRNDRGQLGDGTTVDRRTPVRVCAAGAVVPCTSFLSGVRAVSAGAAESAAVLADGSVVTWGDNGAGQLGDGTNTMRALPGRVCAAGAAVPCTTFLAGVATVDTDRQHMLAVAGGVVYAWGNNGYGQLGDGTETPRATPVKVCAPGTAAPCTSFLSGITAVSAGGVNNSYAITSGRELLAWGSNTLGQLGNMHLPTALTPVRVCAPDSASPCTRFLSDVTAVSSSGTHVLAIAGGVVHSWGNNAVGQLGYGDTHELAFPGRVCAAGATAPCATYLHATKIDSNGGHSLALSGGVLHAWGSNHTGQLGDGTGAGSRYVPTPVCAAGGTAPCGRFLTGYPVFAAGETWTLASAPPEEADLGVGLSAEAELLNPAVRYTIEVVNHGPAGVASGTVTLHVPVSAQISAPSCADMPGLNAVACPVPALGEGQSHRRQIVVTYGLATVGLPVTVTAARAASSPADPEPGNDTASVECDVESALVISCQRS